MRVSTDRQEQASQSHAIEAWLKARCITDYTVFQDVGSGSKDDRTEFLQMCEAVERGVYNSVVCYRLDRISRKSTTALQLLLNWIRADVAFYAVDTPSLHLGHENPFRLTFAAMYADIAEIERQVLISRVRAGLAVAKANGVKLGNDQKLTPDQIKLAKQLRRGGMSCRALGAKFGVSAATISRRT